MVEDAWAARDGDRWGGRCQGLCRELDHDCRQWAWAVAGVQRDAERTESLPRQVWPRGAVLAWLGQVHPAEHARQLADRVSAQDAKAQKEQVWARRPVQQGPEPLVRQVWPQQARAQAKRASQPQAPREQRLGPQAQQALVPQGREQVPQDAHVQRERVALRRVQTVWRQWQ